MPGRPTRRATSARARALIAHMRLCTYTRSDAKHMALSIVESNKLMKLGGNTHFGQLTQFIVSLNLSDPCCHI